MDKNETTPIKSNWKGEQEVCHVHVLYLASLILLVSPLQVYCDTNKLKPSTLVQLSWLRSGSQVWKNSGRSSPAYNLVKSTIVVKRVSAKMYQAYCLIGGKRCLSRHDLCGRGSLSLMSGASPAVAMVV